MRKYLITIFCFSVFNITFAKNSPLESDPVSNNINTVNQNAKNKLEQKEKNWNFTFGVGGGYSSSINLGSKKGGVVPALNIIAEYKNIAKISLSEIQLKAFSKNGFSVGLVGGIVNAGRKYEDDKDYLQGFEDIGIIGGTGLFMEYISSSFIAYTDVRYVFRGGINSVLSNINLTYLLPVNKKFMFGFSSINQITGSQITNAFFEVDETVHQNTNLELYKPLNKNEITLSNSTLLVSGIYLPSAKWSIATSLGYTIIGNKIANSPLVKERGRRSSGLVVIEASYRF